MKNSNDNLPPASTPRPPAELQVIPVIDLQSGQAVHAIAGDRGNYQPISLPGYERGDPLALANFFAIRNPPAIYLADLDAITGTPPQTGIWRSISEHIACPLWIDCGVTSASSLSPFQNLQRKSTSQNCLVIGSETLDSVSHLSEISKQVSPSQLLLSLDRKNGQPLSRCDEKQLLAAAQSLGIQHIIALDLGVVGTSRGLSHLSDWAALQRDFPELQWLLGGGIKSREDLALAQQAGFSGVLSATAILRGIL